MNTLYPFFVNLPNMVFQDRAEAGQKLGERLMDYQDAETIVFALPRGGVVVGAEIARALKVPLEVMIVRKIGHPLQPEFGIAAVTEKGHLVKNEKYAATVNEDWFSLEKERQQTQAQRKRNLYQPALKNISPKDKVAILTDDGVATGLTTEAAIIDLREQQPQRLILTVPVIPKDVADELLPMVDELIALMVEDDFLGAVGAYYEKFTPVSDEEVIKTLKAINYYGI